MTFARRAASLLNVERLLFGGLVVGAMVVVLYLFLPQDGSETGTAISRVTLLDTPASGTGASAAGLDAGKLAPDFEISTPGGQRVRLSDLRGRPVLINFWATWCTSCLTEMPAIKDLQQERGLGAFSVLAINSGETPAQAAEFIDYIDAPFVYGLDTGLVLSDAYGVYGLPVSVFIDSAGVVQATYSGHADRARLEKYTNAAITAQPPGELPVVLRTLSTIPRERVIEVSSGKAGELVVTSRLLRCDPGYCARETIAAFSRSPGVEGTQTTDGSDREYRLVAKYDSIRVTREALVGRLVAALSALKDPVYQGEIQVRYLD